MHKKNKQLTFLVGIVALILLSVFLLESVQARQQTNVYLPAIFNNPVQHKNVVVDGSFETGPSTPNWNESSTNFGTPICNVPDCGTGTGTGPHSGAYWAWFGGVPEYEAGAVSQSFFMPNGTATLTFWLEQIVCDSAADYLEVKLDNTRVFITNGNSPHCGVPGYVQKTIDVSSFANGATHKLEFRSETFANNGGDSNFFVDDVVLDVTYYGAELVSDPAPDLAPSIPAPLAPDSIDLDASVSRLQQQ